MALHEFIKRAGLKSEKDFYSAYPTQEDYFSAFPMERAKMQAGGQMDYGFTPSGRRSRIKVSQETPDWFTPGMMDPNFPKIPSYGNAPIQPQPQNTIPIPGMYNQKEIGFDLTHNQMGKQSYEPTFQGPWNQYSVHDYWNNVPQVFGNTSVQRGQPIEEEMQFKYGGTWINEVATGYEMGGQVDQGKIAGQKFLDYLKSTRQVDKKSIPDRSTPNPFSNTTETPRGPYPQGYEYGGGCSECDKKMQMGGMNLRNSNYQFGGDVHMEDDTFQNEFKKGGWIQGAIRHPGRCTPGSPNYDCPKGSPQWNLAQRFKHGDLHKKQEGGEVDYQYGGPNLEQTMAALGMAGSYLNSNNRFKDLQNNTRQQGMTDNLYAGTMNPAGIKGDFVNTGTAMGQFRPQNQIINQPGAFYPSYQQGGVAPIPVATAPGPDLDKYLQQYAPQSNQQYSSQPSIQQLMAEGPTKLPRKGDISITTNNPGNMLYASWMSKLGAIPSGIKAQDSGKEFAAFPNLDNGFKAYQTQLFGATDGVFSSKYYKPNTKVDDALKKWSGGGYGAEIYPQIQGKTLAQLTPQERDELTKRQIKRESPKMFQQLKSQNYFKEGGEVNDGEYDLDESEIKRLKSMGYQIEYL